MSTTTRAPFASVRRAPEPLPAGRVTLEHLEEWREWRGLSKSELSRRSGVTWPTVHQAERRRVTGAIAAAIAYALEVPVDLLMYHSPRDEEACKWIARHASRTAS